MTDGLRIPHLRKGHQVGLSEVGLPEGNPNLYYVINGQPPIMTLRVSD